MGDVLEASGDIRVQNEFRLKADGVKDSFFGILGAAAWAKAIARWVQSELPIQVPMPV